VIERDGAALEQLPVQALGFRRRFVFPLKKPIIN